MTDDTTLPITEGELYLKKIQNIDLSNQVYENITFDSCTFIKCKFTESIFDKCKFIDCEFDSCDMSSAKFPYSSLQKTVFSRSKLIGIDWTRIQLPIIQLTSPIMFYHCDMSHSNFYGLKIPEIAVESCKAHDVDFREADMSFANFSESDLSDSLFLNSNLTSSDFTDAMNYSINPTENIIRNATFSMPDAMNLLHFFEINIQT